MNLAEFYDDIRAHANRGDKIDPVLHGAVRSAVLWMERNYTLPYMTRYLTFVLGKDKQATVIPCRMKSFQFARVVRGTKLYRIEKVDPATIREIPTDAPKRLWFDGVDYVWFDAIAPEDLTINLSVSAYTDWPTSGSPDEDEFTHWLMDNATDFMLAQTMFNLAPFVREADWFALYGRMREEALKTLILANVEQEVRGSSEKMEYYPEWWPMETAR